MRRIERVFEVEGLDPDEWTEESAQDGQRRGAFDRCVSHVDWTDPSDVRKVLNAFEEIMRWGTPADVAELVRYLQQDGYIVDTDGNIRAAWPGALTNIPLASLRDPAAIVEHLDRIAEASDRDPSMAITGAKAVIEATSKLVLSELGVSYNERDSIPGLVKAVQKALALHPETLAPTNTGADITKRVLSNLAQVAVGVAELRNQYGADHGRTRPVLALGPRHAHLAVGCATTYCRMLEVVPGLVEVRWRSPA